MMGRRAALLMMAGALAGCAAAGRAPEPVLARSQPPSGGSGIHALVDQQAAALGIPRELMHRVVRSESSYNPAARNGPYLGLMQIHPQTARTMGFRGRPEELLDPVTNLTYGGRYLRGAWIVANGDMDRAIGWYRRGYYYEARNRGLLVETGLASRERR
ncbi:transglycosylase SLT domain-containing protein [Rubellimicrobium sp. CFH 75288]|nr:transglycosylase SLT domain-containing protein [Rubellimicrobium sp. CFH 75288]NAZ35503.1 transglycosylase SLT domain-containing protein [Rubellimicrobium sp. CFH 75288]